MSEAPPPTDPQPKMARDMDAAERAQALAVIRRGPIPTPIVTSKKATEMTEQERREYLQEHRKRFGV
jgi:hypothetical protein